MAPWPIASGRRPDRPARCLRRSALRKPSGSRRNRMRACHREWTRGSAKRKPEARWTGCDRAVDGLDGVFRQHAVMTDALDLEQAAVGRKTDFAQFRQIAQTLADAEIIAVVDGRFDAQSPVFFVALFDARG